jgi:antitoxin component HigA of HigAB toxin-antitoxin module
MGLEGQDLTAYTGTRSKVSEVLNMKRGSTCQ